ncbi:MAG TPA: hypothetical protein VFJ05_04995 [Nitrososphaeraceae archaeon]|nr:hypothetical protein [Nitrososphaeraceae archaeon]
MTNDRYMNNTTIITTTVLVFSFLFFVVFLTNTIIVYAQQASLSSSNTATQKSAQSPSSTASPKLHAVKIISPDKGQQIPLGKDLSISGTSIDNATSNCQVSMSVNRVRPYQAATAAGKGGAGANDYSKWNFVLTPTYTTIKPGPDNRITAKYTCTDNPAIVSYASVNVTGVMAAAAAPAATTTAYELQKQPNMMTTTSKGNFNKIIAQDKPSLMMSNKNNNNTTVIGNSVSTHPPPPVSTPINTPGSGELLYLGINTKSVNKGDNTKSAVPHQDSSNDNSFTGTITTKIKTEHTSSSHKSIKTTTSTNNIAEYNSINPSSGSKTKTSHSNNDKSQGRGGVINSDSGHSDPQSDSLYHLFG